jgi:ribosomal protein S18 acetylase RimI-like enzyme
MSILFGVFQSSDLPEMAAVLGQSFSGGEPMAQAVGLTDSEVRQIVEAFGEKAAAERLTMIARVAGGPMVGALLAQDFATPAPAGLANVTTRFRPIGALLDGLDEDYRHGKSIQPGHYLHLFMLGVLPAHEGQGIGRGLVSASLQNARDLGYRMAVSECTGDGSQHIFRECGFVERFRQEYADFLFDGERVFRTISGPVATLLMERDFDSLPG